jgi:hypothetical protein
MGEGGTGKVSELVVAIRSKNGIPTDARLKMPLILNSSLRCLMD